MEQFDEHLLAPVYLEFYQVLGAKAVQLVHDNYGGNTVSFPDHYNDREKAAAYVREHATEKAQTLSQETGYNIRTIRKWKKTSD
ncbi:hypothetical protein [Levilactobacillus namurensis]|uniref:hypothetical protein n=1 Tax=Levilactobacillus namurensis TaxID=380393 RepID=UPI001D62D5B7|nr:hypothetical protein [Levilactobacillus namurensis]HJE45274.1 hypothetical protein [Levilactobacillus namurensis]